jgi:ankyrin repeat protein
MNIQDENGLTALQRACMKGHAALVEILILLGADINLSTANGGTPLDIAIRGGHEEIAQVLFRNGAVRNASDQPGCDFDRGCRIS